MTARSLADQAATRELAVLVGGPFRLRWYWRDELAAMQEASRSIGHADDAPAARMRAYHPTDEHQTHPLEVDVRGRVWRYIEPGERRAVA